MIIRFGFIALVFAVLVPGQAAEPAQKPNIVLILADDFGYGDLGCYGHPYARTPALDQLAKDGTRFAQFYATGVTCCPSRTGLMTSKFPATFQAYPANAGFGTRVTISELLKKSGYRTGHFGKWHIGPNDAAGTYGFDATPSAPGSEGSGARPRRDERGRDAHIFDAAIRFIEASKGGPFYVNVWGHISHTPVNPPQNLVDELQDLTFDEAKLPPGLREKFAAYKKLGGDPHDALRRYLAEVMSLDRNVERLLKRLDELGLRKNTIVVFSSDQGPAFNVADASDEAPAKKQKPRKMKRAGREPSSAGGVRPNMMGSAGPLRGGKHGQYEGGVRVPFIVRWPGRVPAGRVDERSVISGADWLPTLCRLADIEIDAKDFDGKDVSAAWLGGEHLRTKPLFWKTNAVASPIAIRDGRWKLHEPARRRGEPELYDIPADPGEAINLASEHPEVVKTLQAKVEAWKATLPKEYIKTADNDD